MLHEKPVQVGLSGGIGSGKSTVARIFSLLGVPIYESDDEAKKLYFNPEIKKEIIELLGPLAYISDHQIDRSFIAAQIFDQPELREKINGILHPAVRKHYAQWVGKQTHPYVLKVAALLFEANIYKNLDLTLLVISPLEVRLERIKQRDASRSDAEIQKIIRSQMADEVKIPLSSGLIYNDDKHSLIEQVMDWDLRLSTKHGPR